MPATRSKTAALVDLAGLGPVRPRDLLAAGIPSTYLRRLCDRGILERIGRGLYRLADFPATEQHSLALVAKRVPHGTICLLSALQLHGLTTETPHTVWLMIDRHARRPRLDQPHLEVIRASGPALDYGVEIRQVEGVEVRVTSAAKTIADCFRYRRHVGLEVAVEALREYLRKDTGATPGQPRVDALVEAAHADRIWSVLRPYVEALA